MTIPKYVVAITMLLVCLAGLVRPMWGPISLYACPGMIYGAVFPPGIERESIAWIEGGDFGKAAVSGAANRSLRNRLAICQIYPDENSLVEVVELLLSKRWQDKNRAIEAEWKVKQPAKPPTMVEDWHDDPLEINLVNVRAADIGVYAMSYDVITSELTTHRIAHKRQQKP